MYSKTFCVALQGIEGQIVSVEADVCDGLPLFSMVGDLSSEVKEAKERVKVALKNFGFRLPPKRITINLSPADLRKEGTAFDLAIAIAILAALGGIPQQSLEDTLFMGELNLEGKVTEVKGILPAIYAAQKAGMKRCIVPENNKEEGAVVKGMKVIGVSSLLEAVEYLNEKQVKEATVVDLEGLWQESRSGGQVDFKEVAGQETLKRAVEVAVSGMHHLLMIGAPGGGKTLVAQRIPTIMPELCLEESLEITKVYSVAGLLLKDRFLIMKRPFRSPHHTITKAGLVGGGRRPLPGEISLATGGVLFLDELTEFHRETLDLLRQPLEEKHIMLSRAEGNYRYPADFMLVGAMNPCRCGYYPDTRRCTCSREEIARYQAKLSGPLLDRIDICAEAVPLTLKQLTQKRNGESSAEILKRVKKARAIQQKRFRGEAISFNGGMTPEMVEKHCVLNDACKELMEKIFERENFSARGYHKILKVARTIADLERSETIEVCHLTESIFYRVNDKKYWS